MHYHRAHANNAKFIRGDLLQCIAQEILVIIAERGDYTGLVGNRIGRIPGASESYFKNRSIYRWDYFSGVENPCGHESQNFKMAELNTFGFFNDSPVGMA